LLATGDFDLSRSDVDFLMVTYGELPEALVGDLKAMHQRRWLADRRG